MNIDSGKIDFERADGPTIYGLDGKRNGQRWYVHIYMYEQPAEPA